jgi:transcriptional regulator with XRE-family HTH domain
MPFDFAKFRSERRRRGIYTKTVAKRSGYAATAITDLELGRRSQNITLTTAENLAAAIGLKLAALLVHYCPICGNKVDGPPTGNITCSPECGSKLSAISRTGEPRQWSNAARKRLSGKGQTENLKSGTQAARLSPISGPFETNQEAKIWHLRNTRTQTDYVVTNLRKFCRDNPHLFAPSPWESAYAGLRQVQATLFGSRKNNPTTRYKNWTLIRPAMDKNKNETTNP